MIVADVLRQQDQLTYAKRMQIISLVAAMEYWCFKAKIAQNLEGGDMFKTNA